MRNLYAATLYPGIGAFESTNLSVGRGTDTPFEHVGAPWIDGVRLAEALNARGSSRRALLSGAVHADRRASSPTRSARACSSSSPTASALRPVRVGVEIASALVKLFPGKFEIDAGRAPVRIDGRPRAHQGRRRSGGDRGVVGRRRSALAAAAREDTLLGLDFYLRLSYRHREGTFVPRLRTALR